MKSKAEFIDKSKYPNCWWCDSKGCKTCKGTGKFKESSYILIYTDKNGKKQAFQVDSLK